MNFFNVYNKVIVLVMTFIDVVAPKGAVIGLYHAMSNIMQHSRDNRESTKCNVDLGSCWAVKVQARLQELSCSAVS